MKYFPFFPAILLVLVIVFANLLGNDKSPFIVLFVIGISIFTSLGAVIAILTRKVSLRSFLIIIFPTVYSIVVLFLAKQGMVDSQIFLGFR